MSITIPDNIKPITYKSAVELSIYIGLYFTSRLLNINSYAVRTTLFLYFIELKVPTIDMFFKDDEVGTNIQNLLGQVAEKYHDIRGDADELTSLAGDALNNGIALLLAFKFLLVPNSKDMLIVSIYYIAVRLGLYSAFEYIMNKEDKEEELSQIRYVVYQTADRMKESGISNVGAILKAIVGIAALYAARNLDLILSTLIIGGFVVIDYQAYKYCCSTAVAEDNDVMMDRFDYRAVIDDIASAMFLVAAIINKNWSQIYPLLLYKVMDSLIKYKALDCTQSSNDKQEAELLKVAKVIAMMIFFCYSSGVNQLIVMTSVLSCVRSFKNDIDDIEYIDGKEYIKEVLRKAVDNFPIIKHCMIALDTVAEYTKQYVENLNG